MNTRLLTVATHFENVEGSVLPLVVHRDGTVKSLHICPGSDEIIYRPYTISNFTNVISRRETAYKKALCSIKSSIEYIKCCEAGLWEEDEFGCSAGEHFDNIQETIDDVFRGDE